MCIHVTKPQHIPQTSTLAYRCSRVYHLLSNGHTHTSHFTLSLPVLPSSNDMIRNRQTIHSFIHQPIHPPSQPPALVGRQETTLTISPCPDSMKLKFVCHNFTETLHIPFEQWRWQQQHVFGPMDGWMVASGIVCTERQKEIKRKNNWANGNNYKRETNWK